MTATAAIAIATTVDKSQHPARLHTEGGLFFYAKIKSVNPRYSTTDYRYPSEHVILFITILVVLLVIALTATATVCVSAIFVLVVLAFGYTNSRGHHQELMAHAQRVTPSIVPEMAPLVQQGTARLQVEPVDVFIVPSNQLNAYTFGLSSPKAIVLYSSLFKLMDREEMLFILGHEMGHVRLGHTWLNTLVGGMAGIPSSLGAAAVMQMAFRWWNRACEFSADRAGLLACGSSTKAISALVKFEAGAQALTQSGMQAAIQRLEREDDGWMDDLAELMGSHPQISRRIAQIHNYARTAAYQRTQALMNQNLAA